MYKKLYPGDTEEQEVEEAGGSTGVEGDDFTLKLSQFLNKRQRKKTSIIKVPTAAHGRTIEVRYT